MSNHGKHSSPSSFGEALPLMLSMAGTLAAGIAASSLKGDDKRSREPDHDDDGSIFSGAKMAGIAGLLKAVGSGSLPAATATAAKTLAARKVAEYAASALAGGSSVAARHPKAVAAGSYGLMKAGKAAKEGVGRSGDAYRVLRGGRQAVQTPTAAGSSAVTALTLLGVGAAAMYLFHPDLGRHRRRVLREKVVGLGQSAAESASHLGRHAGDAVAQAKDVADKAQDLAGDATSAAREATNGRSDAAS
jgi:hypothetical protein